MLVDAPIHDTAAEAGALACVLTADRPEQLLDQLEADDFHDLRHRVIFGALLAVQYDNRRPDCVSLAQELKDRNEVEHAGGLTYVAALPDQTPSPANFPSFLATVKDRTERRRMVEEAHKQIEAAGNFLVPTTWRTDCAGLLESRRVNFTVAPAPIKAVYTLAGQVISTPGNLTTVTSGVKIGKSAVVGAMVAATMVDPAATDRDTLGFWSENPEALAVLWFDSEQSPDDFWHCHARALRRAGLATPPPWLHAYCLTGLGHKRAWECVKRAIRNATDSRSGTHSFFLDGAADFVADVNDAGECNAFVAELHQIAIEEACSGVNVIHFNPGTEKTRGHLESQLERKAETNLRLDKEDGVTGIWSEKQRRAPIPRHAGPCFSWDDAAGMHTSTATRHQTRDQRKAESLGLLADAAFGDRPSMRYTDLVQELQKQGKMADRSARGKISEMHRLGVIKKSVGGLLIKATTSTPKAE